jgi:hypothetical protein
MSSMVAAQRVSNVTTGRHFPVKLMIDQFFCGGQRSAVWLLKGKFDGRFPVKGKPRLRSTSLLLTGCRDWFMMGQI